MEKSLYECSQKSLSRPVNAGRMRLLQYHDPVRVSSESRTRGRTKRSRSFSCYSGCLTWSEDGLQRQRKPSVVQPSNLYTNIDAVLRKTQSVSTEGSDIRRTDQGSSFLCRKISGTTYDKAGRKVMPKPHRDGGFDLEREDFNPLSTYIL